MTPQQAISLIEKCVQQKQGTWADIGAGTGTFTLALREILASGTIYAVDKNPHALWRLPLQGEVKTEVVEGDFTKKMEFPMVGGILMANSLHYAADPVAVLKNVLSHLQPGGTFLLIEYETHTPLLPWIPYPVPFARFQKIAMDSGLSAPVALAKVPSGYGHGHIYSASCIWKEK
ncbi:MAG: class I SAM-dependent methyltransferase [Lewinellaceae bacterium]|nr:class I SAM-dependent methyltransferase [Saprospiraceae bacterium]MCB9341894.1 class I SAM-dependent methyltransferase [Lewinellaceae bacterium]